jgi:hypothetical protein
MLFAKPSARGSVALSLPPATGVSPQPNLRPRAASCELGARGSVLPSLPLETGARPQPNLRPRAYMTHVAKRAWDFRSGSSAQQWQNVLRPPPSSSEQLQKRQISDELNVVSSSQRARRRRSEPAPRNGSAPTAKPRGASCEPAGVPQQAPGHAATSLERSNELYDVCMHRAPSGRRVEPRPCSGAPQSQKVVWHDSHCQANIRLCNELHLWSSCAVCLGPSILRARISRRRSRMT